MIQLEKKVQDYIDKQEPFQKEIIRKLREIFHKTLPNCKETFAWGVIVLGDDKFYIASIKDRAHIGFAITGLSEDEIKLFEGSGKTMRHLKILSYDDIDENKLISLIKLVDKKATCIKK